ncbi:MAG: hypothetical protein ACK5ND_02985 [Bacteroides sp.]
MAKLPITACFSFVPLRHLLNGFAPENGTFYSHFLHLNGHAPENSPIVGYFVHFVVF